MAIPGLVTLIGSGEVSAGMVKVHRQLLDDLGRASPRAVFLETPAGFEMGVDAIAARFQEYFRTSLGLDLRLAHYRSRADSPATVAQALEAVAEADYIIAGPGSPTYAVEQLRDTALLATILRRWNEGAQLVFASAATVALGRHALPVYEIYKVGRPLGWTDGLDLLGGYGLELAIVPHWDNAEGGTHDTRACFMGMERFGKLQDLLPGSATVLGVDEHTAVTFDLAAGSVRVQGKGGLTVVRGGETSEFESGAYLTLEPLRGGGGRASAPGASGAHDAMSAEALGAASARIGAGDLPGALRLAAEGAPPEMAALLLQAASDAQVAQSDDEELGPLLQILIDIRAALRERGEWALADGLRDRLAAIGFELRDTAHGTVWSRRPV
ncbi:MAG TPA: Type 1 glutamine amidotransferase-like domain-containing protein [Anaerolineales bacterium]|nr:Type 1 glutamine amidotransferase-like domain-containing protein [Anaerolineales bacterium]